MYYPKIVASLIRHVETPGFARKYSESNGSSQDFNVRNWMYEVEALSKAHRFEFNDDVSFLLTMTDNELDGDYHLPYPITFLDCKFRVESPKGGLTYHGILLSESDRVSIALASDGDEGYNIVCGYQPNEIASIQMPVITCTAFIEARPGEYIDVMYPLSVDRKELVRRIDEKLDKMNLELMKELNVTSFGKMEERTLEAMTANFLDLLSSHDVSVSNIPVSERRPEDRRPNPPRSIVRLSFPLTEYVNSVMKGPHKPYNHAFWVRGHWKHWKNDRYAKSGKQGTKTWVPPYVKGMNELVQKKYDAVTNYSRF